PNSSTDDTIRSLNNSDTLENAGNLIDGYGLIGGSYLNLINDATIMADQRNGDLIIDAGSMNGTVGVIANGGLLEANGGTLVVDSPMFNYGLFPNPFFGTLEPRGGGDFGAEGTNSIVELRDGGITGGRLWTTGGARFVVTGNATLDGGSVVFPHGGSRL